MNKEEVLVKCWLKDRWQRNYRVSMDMARLASVQCLIQKDLFQLVQWNRSIGPYSQWTQESKLSRTPIERGGGYNHSGSFDSTWDLLICPPFPPPFLNLCLRKDGWCPSKVTNNYLCTVKSVCQSKSPLYICTVAGAAVIFLLNICALVFPATFIQVTGHIVVNLETDFMLC
jgi:hypothetical protein